MIHNKSGPCVKVLASLAAIVVALLMAGGTMSAAYAVETEETKIERLIELTPGITGEEVKEAVRATAETLGLTYEQTLDLAVVEAETHSFHAPQAIAAANLVLGGGRQAGDVFYSPASTLGVVHGHSGIYTSPSEIVEAPGPGKKSRYTHCTNVLVGSGTQKQSVSTSTANRVKAANKAKTYVGRDYNYQFWSNKTQNGSMNCSQLVWASYYYSSKLDLDSNGGTGVYPKDILNSKYTVTYKTM